MMKTAPTVMVAVVFGPLFPTAAAAVSPADSSGQGSPQRAAAESPVQFARDVLPILSENCFACHGPDENQRQADLRLDREADAKRDRLGGAAIVPGDPEASGLIARLTSTDEFEVMPPPDSGERLEPEEIALLRRWIAQGAPWQQHWAFQPLVRPPGTLDSLVADQLARHGLKLQPAASPRRLARRLSLDLIGLPPTPEQADAMAADPSPEAYERFVDRLLASPRFGEHWARMWLDLARYADTKGYEKDLGRTMWPYRDWVIDAFNADMPLDQFTIEQLAGDLLPHPSRSQRIATAFHRNTMSNDEGGTDNEEFRVAAVKDRVNTTIQVWMGLTMGCAQCHSHKYDPISHKDYYRFYAIFNQTEDADRPDDAPRMQVPTRHQQAQRQKLRQRQAALRGALQRSEKRAAVTQQTGASDAEPPKAESPEVESPEVARLREALAATERQLAELNDRIAKLPILRELPKGKRRPTHIHNRGNFLDPGESVEPAVLSAFHPLPESAPPNRLGVARWLVSRDNPLTPRVWANRIWARLFGRGLVETEGDFGAAGSLPSNPQLLDWLAAEYRDGGWSLKRLLKAVVMSDTYRQRSRVDAAAAQADPPNQWASRGARYRLSAEALRDSALFVSGLLSRKMGGPSVMPPQPPGLWRSTYNGQEWINAEGEDRVRRGLYTYLKRTTPYPSLVTFDGGSGEVCLVRRVRTNTPLQALVTLNDPVYLEAAAGLARRMVTEASGTRARAERGLRLALIRRLRAGEADPLVQLQREAQRRFEAEPEKAAALIDACRGEPGAMTPAAFASWIVTASAILNLDEFLTRN